MTETPLPIWITPGARFRLIQMGADDPCPVVPGSTGTIRRTYFLFDRWQIDVSWDPQVQRSLSLVWPTDQIEPA